MRKGSAAVGCAHTIDIVQVLDQSSIRGWNIRRCSFHCTAYGDTDGEASTQKGGLEVPSQGTIKTTFTCICNTCDLTIGSMRGIGRGPPHPSACPTCLSHLLNHLSGLELCANPQLVVQCVGHVGIAPCGESYNWRGLKWDAYREPILHYCCRCIARSEAHQFVSLVAGPAVSPCFPCVALRDQIGLGLNLFTPCTLLRNYAKMALVETNPTDRSRASVSLQSPF